MSRNKLKLDVPTVSFSALESYKQCPTLYKNKYLDKKPYSQPLKPSLLVGSWAHTLLEQVIIDNHISLKEVYTEYLPDWLEDCKVELNSQQLKSLIETTFGLKDLLWRASNLCNDNSKIRNNNGSIPRNPIDYPSSSFKTALLKNGLNSRRSTLDQVASLQNKEFIAISLCWNLAQALHLSSIFKMPKYISKSLFTELGFSTTKENLVPLTEDVYLLGYIDWIVELEDGRVAIIDHKTSTKCPNELEVVTHPQLNLYAYAYKLLFHKYPDIIGIHHMKSTRIILTELDELTMRDTVEYYGGLYKASVRAMDYTKHHPNDYLSPCVKLNEGRVTSACPYLKSCWGNYQSLLHY